jgi:hypothetical protein
MFSSHNRQEESFVPGRAHFARRLIIAALELYNAPPV